MTKLTTKTSQDHQRLNSIDAPEFVSKTPFKLYRFLHFTSQLINQLLYKKYILCSYITTNWLNHDKQLFAFISLFLFPCTNLQKSLVHLSKDLFPLWFASTSLTSRLGVTPCISELPIFNGLLQICKHFHR